MIIPVCPTQITGPPSQRVQAAYQEIMCVTNGALSARKIIAPTPIGNKVLQSGNTILVPIRQLHQNKAAFADPSRFDQEKDLEEA